MSMYPSDTEISARAERVHDILDSIDAVDSYAGSDGQSVNAIEPADGVSHEDLVSAINAQLEREFSLRDVYAHISIDGDVRVQLFELYAE